MKWMLFKTFKYKIQLSAEEITDRVKGITYIAGDPTPKPYSTFNGSVYKSCFSITSATSSELPIDPHPCMHGSVIEGESHNTLIIRHQLDRKDVFRFIFVFLFGVMCFFVKIFYGERIPDFFLWMPLITSSVAFVFLGFFEHTAMSNNIYTIEKLFENEIQKM